MDKNHHPFPSSTINALPSSSTSEPSSLTSPPKTTTATTATLQAAGMITSTPTSPSTPMMNRTGSSSPKCRRPSPLRNNSICSDDLERATSSHAAEDDEHTSSSKSLTMGGSGLISPSPIPKKSLILGLNLPSSAKENKRERTPLRRDSGSEVEDVLFSSPFTTGLASTSQNEGEMEGLDFGFSTTLEAVKGEEEGVGMIVDSKEEMSGSRSGLGLAGAGMSGSTTSMGGRKANKGINYNPSINGSVHNNTSTTTTTNSSSSLAGKQHAPSSFIRPKPSFPRSAPLRPLTLTLSSSSSSAGMNLNSSSSSLTGGGRYSTPHAGMMSSKSQSGGASRSAQQGRQKVIVPKKGWKMSFDLGLTQSELARVA